MEATSQVLSLVTTRSSANHTQDSKYSIPSLHHNSTYSSRCELDPNNYYSFLVCYPDADDDDVSSENLHRISYTYSSMLTTITCSHYTHEHHNTLNTGRCACTTPIWFLSTADGDRTAFVSNSFCGIIFTFKIY